MKGVDYLLEERLQCGSEKIRSYIIGGERWFVGVDVGIAFGIGKMCTKHVSSEHKTIQKVATIPGSPAMTMINTAGLEELIAIFGVSKKEAHDFVDQYGMKKVMNGTEELLLHLAKQNSEVITALNEIRATLTSHAPTAAPALISSPVAENHVEGAAPVKKRGGRKLGSKNRPKDIVKSEREAKAAKTAQKIIAKMPKQQKTRTRQELTDLIKELAGKRHLPIGEAWGLFNMAFNKTYGVRLQTRMRSWGLTHSVKGKLTVPKYLEATGHLEDAFSVIDKLLSK
jgi:hypothetical protein